MNYYEQLVGSRIKVHRKALGFTQEAFERLVGADQSRISRWENGHALPDEQYRAALLKALNLSELQLFGIDESVYPRPAPGEVSEAILILSHFQDADPALKIAVLTLLSDDKRYLSAFRDPDRRRLAERKLHEFREFFGS